MKIATLGIQSTVSHWAGVVRLAHPTIRAHAPLFWLVAAQISCAAALKLAYPDMTSFDAGSFLMSLGFFVFGIIPVSVVTLRFYHVARYLRPRHPISALARDVRAYFGSPDRFANGMIIVVLYVPFISTFSYLKSNIPNIQPFSWDATFTEWDRIIFMGNLPWELLQPLIGFAPITFAINVLYNLWFAVMWITVVAFAFARTTSVLRTRFFLTFFVIWSVGGSFVAIVFSSAGPCYYQDLGLSPNPYASLMLYLQNADDLFPILALETQALLWAGYEGDSLALGISAMPSMHNATALLLALVGWKVNRRLGVALSVFAATIFVGSVALAWHYAVDGFVAYALTLLAWWMCGRFACWWEARGPASTNLRTDARFSVDA